MVVIQDRRRYQPGFGVSMLRLPLFLILALLAAALAAWCLTFAFFTGWYATILLPIFVALGLGGLLYVIVGWAHCRNRHLAAAVGIAAGAVGYLGYYQLCLVEALPPGVGWQVNLLPDYIMFRMQTDVEVEFGQQDNAAKDAKPSAFLNWFAFGIEMAAFVGMGAAVAWNRARRAYCPELARWMHREKALLPPDSGLALVDALATGRLAEFVASTRTGGDDQTACRFFVEYVTPTAGSPFDYPVYATVEGRDPTRAQYLLPGVRRTLVRQVELKPAEALAVQPLFPNLTQRLKTQHPELRDLPSVVPGMPMPEAPSGEVAEITPVPEPFRQRIRTKGYAIWVNVLGATPLVYLLGGGGLVALGVWLATARGMPLGWAAVAAGAGAIVWGVYIGLYCMCVPENRWINRRLRREIGDRPDPLVSPQDPESVLVSLTPREAFNAITLTMSSDLLLLKIDEAQRLVIMEGDTDRYRIPAGAVTICEPECFFHPIDTNHTNELWMARLVIQVEEGPRELLLSADPTTWAPVNNKARRRIAENLCQRINGLRG